MLIRLFRLFPLPLQQLFHAAFLFAVMGVISFVVGELLPRSVFHYAAFPFHPFKWENGGQIYQKIGIHKWKDRLPDMSRYVKSMVSKKIVSPRDPDRTHRLILETCVAELIHDMLILMSPIFRKYLIGVYGDIAALLCILGNLPFVLIQRYNRPRLVRLMERQIAFREREALSPHELSV